MTESQSAGPAKRDGVAVASLISGVLGFFGITALLGIVLGIAALVRIHRTGERGRGLAIGGIAAGAVWAMALPIAAIVLLAGLLSASNAPIAALQVDNCYNTARPGHDAARVPCSDQHDGVVLDAFTMADPQASYPGDREVKTAADRSCRLRMADLFGGGVTIPPGLVLVGYAPDEDAWTAGARVATCGLQAASGRLSGPLPR